MADVTLTFDGELGGTIKADLSHVKEELASLTKDTHKITLRLDDSEVKNKIRTLKSQIEQIEKLNVRLSANTGKLGSNGSGRGKQESMTAVTAQIKAQQSALRQIKTLIDNGYKDILTNPLKNAEQQTNALRQFQSLQKIVTATMGSNKVIDVGRIEKYFSGLTGYINTARSHTVAFANALSAVQAKLNEISSGAGKLNKTATASDQYKTFNDNLNAAMKEAKLLTSADQTNPASISRMQTLAQQTGMLTNAYKALSAESATVAKAQKQMASAVSKEFTSIQSGIRSLEKNFRTNQKFGSLPSDRIAQFKSQMQALRTEISAMRGVDFADPANAARVDALREKLTSLQSSYAKLGDEAKNLASKHTKSFAQMNASSKQIDALKDKISNFLNANRRLAGTQYSEQLSGLLSGLDRNGITRQGLNEIEQQFKRIKQSAADAGKTGKTFSETVIGAFKKFGGWAIVTHSMQMAIGSIRQIITNVRELDTAMTELKKVTDENSVTYDKFFQQASTRSKEIGASLTDTITATADFARLGYSLQDASKLADTAIVYKNVGDGITDISEASESIISTMKAFGIEASNAMSVTDKFNEVGKELCPVA